MEYGQTGDLPAERVGGDVSFDLRVPLVHPERNEVSGVGRSIPHRLCQHCLPRVPGVSPESVDAVAGRQVLAYGVTHVTVHASFPLFEVDRVRWEVPMDDCVAVEVEIETLLADRGRGEHERPERRVERRPHIAGTTRPVFLLRPVLGESEQLES